MSRSPAAPAPGEPPTGWTPLAAAGLAVAVLGLGALVGRRNAPDASHPRLKRWYDRLNKPGFTPPRPVFGAVWPVLETAAAVGGYRLLRAPPSPRRNAAVALWLADSAMIGGWTELFFRRRRLGSSTAAAGAMAVGSAMLAGAAWRVDRPAAIAVTPLAAWLGFATILAGAVWQRNQPAPARRTITDGSP